MNKKYCLFLYLNCALLILWILKKYLLICSVSTERPKKTFKDFYERYFLKLFLSFEMSCISTSFKKEIIKNFLEQGAVLFRTSKIAGPLTFLLYDLKFKYIQLILEFKKSFEKYYLMFPKMH